MKNFVCLVVSLVVLLLLVGGMVKGAEALKQWGFEKAQAGAYVAIRLSKGEKVSGKEYQKLVIAREGFRTQLEAVLAEAGMSEGQSAALTSGETAEVALK